MSKAATETVVRIHEVVSFITKVATALIFAPTQHATYSNVCFVSLNTALKWNVPSKVCGLYSSVLSAFLNVPTFITICGRIQWEFQQQKNLL